MENNTAGDTKMNNGSNTNKMNTCGGCGCGHHHMHILKWLLKIAILIVVFCFAFQMGELKGMLRAEGGNRGGYGHVGTMMYPGNMMMGGGVHTMTAPATGSTVSPAVPMTPTP